MLYYSTKRGAIYADFKQIYYGDSYVRLYRYISGYEDDK